MKFDSVYDYLIVGGGSAGCVLANRLSEDPANKVCLLEAGPRDAWWNWKIHMPAALMYNLMDDRYNWYYHTEPQPYMNERVMYWPRGRVLGGSSSLNAMVYIRGHALDYDRWAFKENCEGWSYAGDPALLPARRASREGRRRLSRRQRPAVGPHRRPAQPAVRGLHPGGAAGRLCRHRRHERLSPGRLRQDGHDHPSRPALVSLDRLPAAGRKAAQHACGDQRVRAARSCSRAAAPSASNSRRTAGSCATGRSARSSCPAARSTRPSC